MRLIFMRLTWTVWMRDLRSEDKMPSHVLEFPRNTTEYSSASTNATGNWSRHFSSFKCESKNSQPLLGWVVGFKGNCPLVGPRRIVGVPSVGSFLRDSKPVFTPFSKKTQKTPNSSVDKRDRVLNQATPVFQFWALPLQDTGRASCH